MRLLPDIERLAHDYLLTVTDITTLVGTRMSSRSAETPTYPYLTLQRIGGSSTNAPDALDTADIQVDAYAATREEANVLIRTVIAAFRAAGGYRNTHGMLAGSFIVTNAQWLPDTLREPPTPRYSATFALYAKSI